MSAWLLCALGAAFWDTFLAHSFLLQAHVWVWTLPAHLHLLQSIWATVHCSTAKVAPLVGDSSWFCSITAKGELNSVMLLLQCRLELI